MSPATLRATIATHHGSRPPRKPLRLDHRLYAEVSRVCSVTIAVQGRQPIFSDPAVAAVTVAVLRDHASRTGVPVYAYCLMPDHMHLLLSASPTCDLFTFVAQLENLAQRAAWRLGVHGSFWQRRFYDHFLRADEDLRRTVEYVLQNPVKAGLVGEWRDYPFCGSLVYEL